MRVSGFPEVSLSPPLPDPGVLGAASPGNSQLWGFLLTCCCRSCFLGAHPCPRAFAPHVLSSWRVLSSLNSPGQAPLLLRCVPLCALYTDVCMRAQSLSHILLLCDPMDCSPPGSSVHGDSPGKNTGVGCLALLQGIFLAQGLNSLLLHWQADSLP